MSETEGPSIPTRLAFFLSLAGGIISIFVFGLSLTFQLTVVFPSLPEWMQWQIYNYFILDAFTLMGSLLMIIGAWVIYTEGHWPYGGVLAFFGAFITINIFSVILGVIGGFVNICGRPKPKRV